VDDAIANLEIAHTVAPPSASSLSLLGDMYLNEDAHELALYNYQASLKQDPTTRPEQALKPLRRLMQLGLFDAARTYLKLIDSSLQSELSPEQAAEKTVVAAQLTIEAGNLEQGLAQLQSVLNEQPLNGDALLLMANVQLDQEAYATATFYFERATSVVEVQVEALVGLARTAVAQSRFQAALKHLQQSQRIKQRPDVAQFMASIEKVIAAQ
jgi:tetratricopeptide (TPR) repeat protein